MIIKSNHKNVDMEGLVYMPYLHQWNRHSDLLQLCQQCCATFSAEPPLFAKPPEPTPSYSSNVVYSQAATTSAVTANNNNSFATNYNTNNNTSYDYGSILGKPSVAADNSTSNSNGASVNDKTKRLKLIDEVTMRLYQELHIKHLKLRDQLNEEFQNNNYLEDSRSKGNKTLETLRSTISAYEKGLEEISAKDAALDNYIAEQKDGIPLLAEERLRPYDELSAQMISLASEIGAVDDTIYFLERALVSSQNKTVDFPIFLKECRKLARKQFLSKAHLMKINNQLALMDRQHYDHPRAAGPALPMEGQQQMQQRMPAMPIYYGLNN